MAQLSEAIQQGKELVEQLRLDEAVNHFEKLLAKPSEEKEARIWLARLALMGDDFDHAESQLKIILDSAPANSEALALEGIFHMKQCRFERAARALEAARAHDPELAMVYPNLALTYRELNRLSESLTAAYRGVKLLPEDPQAHLEVARTLWALKQPQAAIKQTLRAVQLDPLYLFAYLDLGRWLVLEGRPETAVDLYLEGIRHAPDAWPLREQLVGLYLLSRQSRDALSHAQFLAEQRGLPGDYILLGDCLAVSGGAQAAETAYQKAIKLDSGSWLGHLKLAELYRSANLIAEAEAEYRSAASIGESYVPLNELGLFLLHQKRFDEATPVLNRAVQLDPTGQEAKLNLALCYAALERKAQAADLARQVSANSPEGSHLREEADRLVGSLR
jgi:tetratricopeptide (TPR) repeat protein